MPTPQNNETALVAQAQMGDKDAFTTLYNQHSQKVYRFALRLTGDHQEAEDVLQDAFLKAFVHLGEFRNEARFSTWLISIAGNEVFSRRRRRAALQKRFRWIPGQSLTESGKCGATFKPIKTMPRKLAAGSSRSRFSQTSCRS